MKHISLKTFFFWLPCAALLSIFCALVYVAVQQNFRMGANDPQIQMAEEIAGYLDHGVAPDAIIASDQNQIDISTSLDPYLVIFDGSGKVLASSANLHGNQPALPSGVFASVRSRGEVRFTWQPERGVRSAVVVTGFNAAGNSGFVLAGRSLREVEIRENNLLLIIGFVWAFSMVFLFALIFILVKIYEKLIANH